MLSASFTYLVVYWLFHYWRQQLSRTLWFRTGKNERDKYEKVDHHHSWNSDHIVSRMFLFELSRHSDHHMVASRHYQVLRSLDESPQLPTGYPGMILLAMIPPLWFRVMNPLVR